MTIEPRKQSQGHYLDRTQAGTLPCCRRVEHEKQRQYLKERHCDKIQGYLISKPLSEEDALMFLKLLTKQYET